MEEILNYLECISICQEKAIKALHDENFHEFKFQMIRAEMIFKLLFHIINIPLIPLSKG